MSLWVNFFTSLTFNFIICHKRMIKILARMKWNNVGKAPEHTAQHTISEVKWKSFSRVWLCDPMDCPRNSPGQNTGVGSLSLLQGTFPTQGLNPGLPHCRRILYQLSHQGSPYVRTLWMLASIIIICVNMGKSRNSWMMSFLNCQAESKISHLIP